jgi:hypothetical protein
MRFGEIVPRNRPIGAAGFTFIVYTVCAYICEENMKRDMKVLARQKALHGYNF